MKYLFLLSIIGFIIVPCYAMEGVVKQCVEEPNCAQYITNNKIVVGHAKGCDIFDIKHNKHIVQISTFPCTVVAVHPDKTKIVFGGYDDRYRILGLYDTKSSHQKWVELEKEEKDLLCYDSIYFNTSDDTILYSLEAKKDPRRFIQKRDYTGKLTADSLQCDFLPRIAFSVKQQMLCVLQEYGDLVMYHGSCLLKELEKINTGPVVRSQLHDSCCISSEGHIAIQRCYDHVDTIVRTLENGSMVEQKGCLKKQENEKFFFTFFYPKDSIIVTMSEFICDNGDSDEHEYKMRYWDIKTGNVIDTMNCVVPYESIYDYSVGPKRKKISLVLADKYMEFPVSWKVRHQDGTKEKCLYFWWVLKNHIANVQLSFQDLFIPQDIMPLLFKALLKTFRR